MVGRQHGVAAACIDLLPQVARIRAGNHSSPLGNTRTALPPGSQRPLRFVISSCARCAAQLDLVTAGLQLNTCTGSSCLQLFVTCLPLARPATQLALWVR